MVKAIDKGKSAVGANVVAAGEFAPVAYWGETGERDHFVQFYEADDFLLDSLSGYIREGLDAGEACIVVATCARREGLDARLRAFGLDTEGARASNRLFTLDAAETLSRFMSGDSPDPLRFEEVIGGLLARASEGGRRVRAFGEMVALLWADGKPDAAIHLEALWNGLQRKRDFRLFCAYPLNGFDSESHAGPLGRVCAEHSRVIPAESYTSLSGPDERLRAITELQRKARTLEAEIAERKAVESELRAVKEELEMQVRDLRCLHEMSASVTSTLEVEPVLRHVLNATLAVHGTDMGLLSLYDKESDGLGVKVSSGFGEEFLRQVEWVPRGVGAYGTCYARRERVVVEDVETDPAFEQYRDAARAEGFRACHSTPLITRGGRTLGVLSVHFRERHRASEREARLTDLFAQTAADVIENARLHDQAQRELEERKQLLLREQHARAEAERANRLKDEFLLTVSHELRTPLTAILGWSHLLVKTRLDEATAARALDAIERNAMTQAQLVEDILDVSRAVTGKLRLEISRVDLSTVVNGAVDSVQPEAASKSIGLEVTLDPSARHVTGDAGRLQQVVTKLLSNAVKFTHTCGRVVVRLSRADSRVEIAVSDTGQGIAPDFLPYVFDRFRQADQSTTRAHGGLGLGLALVRHLVELHGGTVRAESQGEGQGSTFTVTLPSDEGGEGVTPTHARVLP